jgi:indolepyruvate ferredoxin oxidoreductase beta subunit
MNAAVPKFDLVIAGVGGQGAILASDIIGKAAVKSGFPVRSAETHGMAQRGGSVVNHVRIGRDLGSMVPLYGADLLIALEPVEALRYLNYLSKDGVIVMNTEPVYPVSVTCGSDVYPDVPEIIATLENMHAVKAFNAFDLALEAGNAQAMNVVMVGAASNYIPVAEDLLIECIKEMVPPKTIDINVRAFELGRDKID